MNFGDFKDGKAQQPLPPSLTPYEAEINGFAELCNKTCTRILTLLALGLEVRNQPHIQPTRSTHPPPSPLSIQNYIYIPITNADPRRILHNPTRPKHRLDRQHPTVPVLPFDLLAVNSSLQA